MRKETLNKNQSIKGKLAAAGERMLELGERVKTSGLSQAHHHVANAKRTISDWLQNDAVELEEFQKRAELLCESPIEHLLFTELLRKDFSLGVWGSTRPIALPDRVDLRKLRKRLFANLRYVLIFPQAKIRRRFRLDFLVEFGVFGAMKRVAIECDGQQYHENPTKFATDRERDRILNTNRIPVLRFTGKELNRDPGGCAESVRMYVLQHSRLR